MPEPRRGSPIRTPGHSSRRHSSRVGTALLAAGLFSAGALTGALARRGPPSAPALPQTEAVESTSPAADLRRDLADERAKTAELTRKVQSLESLTALYRLAATAPSPSAQSLPSAAEPTSTMTPPATAEPKATAPDESPMELERQRLAPYEPRMVELASWARELEMKSDMEHSACSGSTSVTIRGHPNAGASIQNADSPECRARAAEVKALQLRFRRGMAKLREDARRDRILPGLLAEALKRYGL